MASVLHKIMLTACAAIAAGLQMSDSALENTTEIVWSGPEQQKLYLGSPSVLRCPSSGGFDHNSGSISTLVASHDTFGPAISSPSYTRRAFVYTSQDNGKSWNASATVLNMYWATLFSRAGDSSIYLMGVSSDNEYTPAQISIAQSTDCGVSWTAAVLLTNASVPFSTGPTPILAAGGRLYRAFEQNVGAWGSGYASLVASVDAAAPSLLDPQAWTVSPGLLFSSTPAPPSSWSIPGVTSSYGWLEGNAVEAPASMPGAAAAIVLRVNSVPAANKAALLRLDTPTSQPVFVAWVESFPGGMSKFTVRRDTVTGLYVILSNNVTDSRATAAPVCGDAPGGVATGSIVSANASLPCCSMTQQQACAATAPACVWCRAEGRNNLTLSVSSDLVTWTIVRTVMQDDQALPAWMSQLQTGFQYVDWFFDGDDILAAVRAGYRGSQSYHNSNRVLLQRLVAWRSWL